MDHQSPTGVGRSVNHKASVQSIGLDISSTDKGSTPCYTGNIEAGGGQKIAQGANPADEQDMTGNPAAFKLSPPGQFDVSKPYMINGQLVYPIPAGFRPPPNTPIMPIDMLGKHNLSHPWISQPVMASVNPTSMQFQRNTPECQPPNLIGGQYGPLSVSSFNPAIIPNEIQSLPQLFSNMSMPTTAPLLGLSASVLLSPIMLIQQIQALQQQLKHLGNQLQNNAHQIDINHVAQQQSFVQGQLATLQCCLNAQLLQAGVAIQGPSSWNAGLGLMGLEDPTTHNNWDLDDASTMTANKSMASLTNEYVAQDVYMPPNSESAAKQGVSSIVCTNSSGSPALSGSASGTRLTLAAALAPEFQPRSQHAGTKKVFETDKTISANNRPYSCSSTLPRAQIEGIKPSYATAWGPQAQPHQTTSALVTGAKASHTSQTMCGSYGGKNLGARMRGLQIPVLKPKFGDQFGLA